VRGEGVTRDHHHHPSPLTIREINLNVRIRGTHDIGSTKLASRMDCKKESMWILHSHGEEAGRIGFCGEVVILAVCSSCTNEEEDVWYGTVRTMSLGPGDFNFCS